MGGERKAWKSSNGLGPESDKKGDAPSAFVFFGYFCALRLFVPPHNFRLPLALVGRKRFLPRLRVTSDLSVLVISPFTKHKCHSTSHVVGGLRI